MAVRVRFCSPPMGFFVVSFSVTVEYTKTERTHEALVYCQFNFSP
jgi:hypothetical protein